MSIKEIKDLLQLMNENNLVEIEMERDGLKIKLKKQASGTITQIVEASGAENGSAPKAAAAAARPKLEEEARLKRLEIKAPMVGTFYRAPSPEGPPFVEIGQTIAKGQVICIIEAMKLMNEIKSEIDGRIVEILAENGDPVEFGQTIFLLEPA